MRSGRDRLVRCSTFSTAPEQSTEGDAQHLAERAGGFLLLLEGAVFHQSDGRREFRLIQGRLQSADRLGSAETGWNMDLLLGQLLDARDVSAAAADEDAGAQVLEQTGLAEVVFDELESLLQADRHNAAQVFQVAGFERQA